MLETPWGRKLVRDGRSLIQSALAATCDGDAALLEGDVAAAKANVERPQHGSDLDGLSLLEHGWAVAGKICHRVETSSCCVSVPCPRLLQTICGSGHAVAFEILGAHVGCIEP